MYAARLSATEGLSFTVTVESETFLEGVCHLGCLQEKESKGYNKGKHSGTYSGDHLQRMRMVCRAQVWATENTVETVMGQETHDYLHPVIKVWLH